MEEFAKALEQAGHKTWARWRRSDSARDVLFPQLKPVTECSVAQSIVARRNTNSNEADHQNDYRAGSARPLNAAIITLRDADRRKLREFRHRLTSRGAGRDLAPHLRTAAARQREERKRLSRAASTAASSSKQGARKRKRVNEGTTAHSSKKPKAKRDAAAENEDLKRQLQDLQNEVKQLKNSSARMPPLGASHAHYSQQYLSSVPTPGPPPLPSLSHIPPPFSHHSGLESSAHGGYFPPSGDDGSRRKR